MMRYALDLVLANLLSLALAYATILDSSDFIFFAEILQLTLLLYGTFNMKCDIF